MGEPRLGCCGYDELAEKPPTTTPLSYPRKNSSSALAAKRQGTSGAVTRPVYSMGYMPGPRFPVLNLPPQG